MFADDLVVQATGHHKATPLSTVGSVALPFDQDVNGCVQFEITDPVRELLPRMTKSLEQELDVLQHLHVLRKGHALAWKSRVDADKIQWRGSAINPTGKLASADRVQLLQQLVEQCRENGDIRPLDEVIESFLGYMRDGASGQIASLVRDGLHVPQQRPSSPQPATVPVSKAKLFISEEAENLEGVERKLGIKLRARGQTTEAAMKTLRDFKARLRIMKLKGLESDAEGAYTITSNDTYSSELGTAESCQVPAPTVLKQISPVKVKRSSRTVCQAKKAMQEERDSQTFKKIGPKFKARPVPMSSLIPKCRQLECERQLKRQARLQERIKKLHTTMLPFKFEYSSGLKQRRDNRTGLENENALDEPRPLSRPVSGILTRKIAGPLVSEKAAKPTSRPGSGIRVKQAGNLSILGNQRPTRTSTRPPPPLLSPEYTFRPQVNHNVPDFKAAHVALEAETATRRASAKVRPSSARSFAGVERHQKILDERKAERSRALREDATDALKRPRPQSAPFPSSRPKHHGLPEKSIAHSTGESLSSDFKVTRSATLKREATARARVEAKKAEEQHVEMETERQNRALRLGRVVRQAMNLLDDRKPSRSATSAEQLRRELRQTAKKYDQFLRDLDLRLSSRPFTFQRGNIQEAASSKVDQKVNDILTKNHVLCP